MARAIWKGNINFGLVNIPVQLYPVENRKEEVAFHLLDRRNLAPIRNERVNEKTGETVPWEEVVKGYEFEHNEYVVMSDEDFRRANVEATQTIDIVDFVDGEQIDPIYYDTPYYLAPGKNGAKGYALLREVLRRTGTVGIAFVIIRTRQHLAAVMERDRLLVLEILRYAYEIRDPKELEIPGEHLSALGVKKNEIELAGKLVEGMVAPWKPEKYHDEYRDDLMELIRKKIRAGRTKTIEEEPEEEIAMPKGAEVVDMMSLLERSVDEARKVRHRPSHRAASRTKSPTRPKKKAKSKR